MTAIAAPKRAHRATWAAGDHAAVAEDIDHVPPAHPLRRVPITLFETNCGPTVKARARLEPEGTWDACRRDLVAVAEEIGEDDDGGLLVRAEYLVRVGTKAD